MTKGPVRAHPGHELDGAILVGQLVVAMCSCGDILDVADAAFEPCPDHADLCSRCGGSGEVIDHEGLAWREATAEETATLRGS